MSTENRFRGLFLFFFLVGALAIGFTVGTSKVWVLLVPIAVMTVFGVLAAHWYSARMLAVGDAFYYMGFAFTLVALVVAMLRRLGAEQLEALVVVQSFGVALTTTVWGLLGRILIQVPIVDGSRTERLLDDAIRDATLAIGEVGRMSSASGRALEDFRTKAEDQMLSVQRAAVQTSEQAIKALGESAEAQRLALEKGLGETVGSLARVGEALSEQVSTRASEEMERLSAVARSALSEVSRMSSEAQRDGLAAIRGASTAAVEEIQATAGKLESGLSGVVQAAQALQRGLVGTETELAGLRGALRADLEQLNAAVASIVPDNVEVERARVVLGRAIDSLVSATAAFEKVVGQSGETAADALQEVAGSLTSVDLTGLSDLDAAARRAAKGVDSQLVAMAGMRKAVEQLTAHVESLGATELAAVEAATEVGKELESELSHIRRIREELANLRTEMLQDITASEAALVRVMETLVEGVQVLRAEYNDRRRGQ